MTGPADLYSELVLEHARRPHRRGRLAGAEGHADAANPLCGDRVEVWVNAEDGMVKEVVFDGEGCAISTASASMMTDALAGQPIGSARDRIDRFLRAVTEGGVEGLPEEQAALAHVRRLPMRVKCATMPWRAALAALDDAEAAGGGPS
ncbi:MAG: SUF system NifU family Fe-S cluster assembly protein [Planctomycetota bacterium]|nr:MAG: SUF system NifU family Fe-S cluster assembly protein [Planctomycetota bacterium]